jgi:hypothetical protein
MSQLGLWRPALLAAVVCVFSAGGTPAQDFINSDSDLGAATSPQSAEQRELSPSEIDAAVAAALSADLTSSALKPLPSRNERGATATWNKVSNSDGSAKYSVSKPLAAPWDASIGADISTAAAAPDVYEPRQLPGTTSNAGSGSAWADVAVPHLVKLEVRAEPGNDYDKFGTKLERSLPLGKSLSMTAQSTLGITELRPASTPGLTVATPDAVTRLYSTDNSLQLNIQSTGTTLLAGATTLTGDPVTHSRLSAGQKIYGPLSITGSIYDPALPTANVSITAGMSFAW